MASTLKCTYCGGTVLSSEQFCPHCGGENRQFVRDESGKIYRPKTIEELKEYCAERGMPLLRMRFFVGEDFREPKAFGIFRAGENRFVVYKNKADGSRAVRYDGPDEAYAVKELFEKLLSECHNRGIYPDGPVGKSSGKRSSGKKKNGDHRIGWILAIVFFALIVVGTLVNRLDGVIRVNRQIDAFRQNPDTWDSRYIGDKYYTYDLDSESVVVSSVSDDHLNDGYFFESGIIYPDDKQFYRTAASLSDLSRTRRETAQETAVCYRDGRDWYAYVVEEQDWRPVKAPAYSGRDNYLGPEWQDVWNVPDYAVCPVQEGYYLAGEACYYRDNRDHQHTWYIYHQDTDDWEAAGCPMKLGVPADGMQRLENNESRGIRSFQQSTPYALEHDCVGYYRMDGTFCYRCRYYTGKSSDTWERFATINNKYWKNFWFVYGLKPAVDPVEERAALLEKWGFSDSDLYAFLTADSEEQPLPGQPENTGESADPDSAVPSGQQQAGSGGPEWHRPATDPDVSSLVYLGSDYLPEWQEEWGVPDFKASAAAVQVLEINGYVRQGNSLYYHYKDNWYTYRPDRDSWTYSASPANDGLPDSYLGDSFAAEWEEDWESDWTATDFKDSAVWANIVQEEAREAERIAREKEQREAAEKSYHSSSDYDDWDIGDTDWDSDW